MEPSSSVHNEIKLLKEENKRLSDKMVLMREKKRQQSHEIEILDDKVGKLKRTNKEMKRKIVIEISPSHTLFITNIFLYIVLLSVFIIIYKCIIYWKTFNSIDFLQYFYIAGFIEDKDEEGREEDKGQGEKGDGQGKLEEGDIDV